MANQCPNRKSGNSDRAEKGKKSHALLMSFVSAARTTSDWFIDSGASAHMTPHNDLLVSNIDRPSIEEVTTANNHRLPVRGMGKINLSLEKCGEVVVNDVMHVPELCANLLSVSQIVKRGNKIVFDQDGCKILDSDNEIFATATESNGMYKLDVATGQCASVSSKAVDSLELWHRRMGHLNFGSLVKLKCDSAIGITFSDVKCDSQQCTTCVQGKQCRLPFKDVAVRAKDHLEIVHSDVCGPIECDSLGGARFYVTFVDDYSRKVFLFTIKSKSEVFDKFSEFKSEIENQTGKRIKILRSDNGTEYVNRRFDDFLKKSGIRHQLTAPYTPEQNGLAERMNRTIVERARCMLFGANLDKSFWAEAVNTAAHVINRSPSRVVGGKTPEEMWSGSKPDLKMLRVFGCMAWVHIPKQNRLKFDAKSERGIFVGYGESSKAFRIYIPEKKKVVISRNVEFFENQHFGGEVSNSVNTNFFDFSSSPDDLDLVRVEFSQPVGEDSVGTGDSEDSSNGDSSGGSQLLSTNSANVDESSAEDDQLLSTSTSESTSDNECLSPQETSDESYYSPSEDSTRNDADSDDEYVPPNMVVSNETTDVRRTSSRPPKPVIRDDFVTFKATAIVHDPTTVNEAINGADSKSWKLAMQEEYDALVQNNTWELVDLPSNRKSIQCKWVFKRKRDAVGQVVRHKARLVVKGCSQKPGIDYEETYSPVVRYSSIRMLLAIAAKFNLDVDQMDAVTAFLQGDLHEEIYMVQPEGFAKGTKVCRLKKSLYGLKQASRNWNIKLDSVLKSSGLNRSSVDPCIYYHVSGDKRIYVAVYVDDLLIVSNDKSMKSKLKSCLTQSFNMKDIGEAKFVLGFRITRDREKGLIWIDQKQYVEELIVKFGMSDCNSYPSPMDSNQKLSSEFCPETDEERKEMAKIPFQAAVGSILFASQVTRPDICYAVNFVSRYNNNPGMPHWTAVKRIIRYLKGTADMKLQFNQNGNCDLIGYSDADYAGDLDQRKSTTGYIFLYQGGPISWNSRKQPTVALSSTESEYMALASASQEAIWLKTLLSELSIKQPAEVQMFCDNKSALSLAVTSTYHPRTKHIGVKHHFIRELIDNGTIRLEYTPSEEMKADVLTRTNTQRWLCQ